MKIGYYTLDRTVVDIRPDLDHQEFIANEYKNEKVGKQIYVRPEDYQFDGLRRDENGEPRKFFNLRNRL